MVDDTKIEIVSTKECVPTRCPYLENAIAHAYVCSPQDQVLIEALPEHLKSSRDFIDGGEQQAGGEANRILAVLQACAWNREEAAKRLGLSRTTLWRRMKRLGLQTH